MRQWSIQPARQARHSLQPGDVVASDPVADREMMHPRPDLDDFARRLMARNHPGHIG